MLGSRARRWVATAAVAVGLAVGVAGVASAASQGSGSAATPITKAAAPGGNPASVSHGRGETLLTGSTAARVKAAALKAVPGATVVRVETDSAGSPYEAHLQKADGSYITVKVNDDFTVTAVQSGFGARPAQSPAAAN
jgi:hypothetical protein